MIIDILCQLSVSVFQSVGELTNQSLVHFNLNSTGEPLGSLMRNSEKIHLINYNAMPNRI